MNMEISAKTQSDVSSPKNIAFGFGIYGTFGLLFGSVGLFAIVWLLDRGVALSIASTMGGITTLATIFWLAIVGRYADKTGKRKQVIQGQLCVGILVMVCLMWAPHTYVVYTGYVVFFTLFTAILPVADSLALHIAPIRSDIKINFLWFRSTLSIAYAIGMVGIGWIFDVLGIHILPYVALILLVAILAVTILLDDSKIAKHDSDKNQKGAILDLLSVPWVKGFYLFILIYGLGSAFYYGFVIVHYDSLGFTKMQSGIIILFGNAMETLFFLFGKPIINRYRPLCLLVFCGLVASLRWWVFAGTTDFYGLCAITLLHGITFGMHQSVSAYFIQLNIPSSLSSTAQSVLQTCFVHIPFTIVLPIVGAIYPILGGDMFKIGAGITFISAVLGAWLLLIKPPSKK